MLSPIAWLANKLYAIEEKGKELCLLSSTTSTVQTRVECNDNENQSVHRAVSKLVKTAINTAITVKLLKSKVTLLNTCEKLKMTHETQCDIAIENKAKVNQTCLKHVTIRLKCGSGWSGSTERIWG